MSSRRAILFAAAFAFAAPAVADHPESDHAAAVSPAVVATKDALRDLWIGHVFWVRNVVDARLARDTARALAAEQQVVANARAIADAIAPYYGQAAADGLFELLAGHWGAISGYLDATVAKDDADAQVAANRLSANAGEIAAFLSGANDNWPLETLRGLLIAHGAHHVQQIDQLAAKQYAEEAVTWAAMKDHMYVIADALAAGIATQFPEKFE
jgi:hypothetical protein